MPITSSSSRNNSGSSGGNRKGPESEGPIHDVKPVNINRHLNNVQRNRPPQTPPGTLYDPFELPDPYGGGMKISLPATMRKKYEPPVMKTPVMQTPVLKYPQAKGIIPVSSPEDREEKEADQVAEQVMTDLQPEKKKKKLSEETSPDQVMGKVTSSGTLDTGTAEGVKNLQGKGSPLPDRTRADMEQSFGADFSNVRIHTGSEAETLSRSMNARAFTHGSDIAFNKNEYSPDSQSGKRLLAHELTHTVQQGAVGRKVIHRRKDTLTPEDISEEMIGREFRLIKTLKTDYGTLSEGAVVIIAEWDNDKSSVKAFLKSSKGLSKTSIPKEAIEPVTAETTLAPYSGSPDLKTVKEYLTKGQEDIKKHRLKKEEYELYKNLTGYNKELNRLEKLQETRRKTLNRVLIQETMYNNLDPFIVKWTDFYNKQFITNGPYKTKWKLLDPNLVKSMIFQESEMGTAGAHLNDTHPVKTRFNVLQAIDSSAQQQYIMMKELIEQKDIEKNYIQLYGLENMMRDMYQAQKKNPDKSNSYWEGWLYDYVGPGQTRSYGSVLIEFITEYLVNYRKRRNESYEYWIRTGIRWLFEKRKSSLSWSDAIRAYNGSGVRAEIYRDTVLERSERAKSSQKENQKYGPSR